MPSASMTRCVADAHPGSTDATRGCRAGAQDAPQGYRTTPVLTARELADLYDLRQLLEPVSARRAAERATDTEREALAAELHRYADAPRSADLTDYARFSEHDALLHQLIAKASGNIAVARALERTHFHLHAFRLAYDVETGKATLEEHVRIVETILSGDGARRRSRHVRAPAHRTGAAGHTYPRVGDRGPTDISRPHPGAFPSHA